MTLAFFCLFFYFRKTNPPIKNPEKPSDAWLGEEKKRKRIFYLYLKKHLGWEKKKTMDTAGRAKIKKSLSR
jgi:hypothetical protein